MVALFAIFVVLTILTLLPVLAVLLGQYEGHLVAKVEKLVSDFDGILVSLGTLFLVSALALLTTLIANKFADRRELANRQTATQLKIAEFRRAWIEGFRNELSEFISLATEGRTDDQAAARSIAKMSSVLMRINEDDPLLPEIENSMSQCLLEKDPDRLANHQAELMMKGRVILKNEWFKLKNQSGAHNEKSQ